MISHWRRKYFGTKTSLILTSIAIGLLTALSAVLLKNGVRLIKEWVEYVSLTKPLPYLIFIFPTVGILLTTIYVQVFRKGNLGRGVANVLYCISRKSSYVPQDKLYSQMISSILTVGFGGSAGLEAPIASTGSAIGSNTARWLHFNYKERMLLLACGAAAGISAIFNAPIAGAIFALEILLVDMAMPAIVPILIASASASLLSQLIYSGQPYILITDTWHSGNIIYYIAFAFIAAFSSVYAIRSYFYLEETFERIKYPYIKALSGGLILGLLIFIFPPLYGEGYDMVDKILHGTPQLLLSNSLVFETESIWYIVDFAIGLMLLKVIATSITIGAGGNGGMFGSSLFMGAMCGFAFARSINLLGWAQLSELHFTVIGMAAMLSGIIHAPLTAIFLIAEITGGYTLFVPLMIVSSLSYVVCRYFEPYSVYTRKLALAGELRTADKDKYVLSQMKVANYIEKDFIPVRGSYTLRTLITAISHSKRNIFPVTDDHGMLLGVILLDNVREVMFADWLYDKTLLTELMTPPVAVVDVNDKMEAVMEKFENSGSWNLPVVDQHKYVGFISKSKIFTHYREELIREVDVPA